MRDLPERNAERDAVRHAVRPSFDPTSSGHLLPQAGEGDALATWIATRKDFLAGLSMLVLGALTAAEATNYTIGTLRRMGPGFFPLSLGVLLAIVGVLIIATTRGAGRAPAGAAAVPEWRGWFCICASIAAFVVLGRYGGLVPATFAIVFVAALGDRQNSLITSLILAAVMTAISVVVFWWLLQIAFPLFR